MMQIIKTPDASCRSKRAIPPLSSSWDSFVDLEPFLPSHSPHHSPTTSPKRNWRALSKELSNSLAANGKDTANYKVSVDQRPNGDLDGLEGKESSSGSLGYKSASFKEMLRYANSFDYCLLTLGLLTAIINGVIRPVSTLNLFRDLTDTLTSGHAHYMAGTLDMDDFTRRILTICFYYFLVGLGVFISSFAAFTCFFTLCERQVHRIRRKFFFAVLNQVETESMGV